MSSLTRDARHRTARSSGSPADAIVVAAGKGGVGTSTVALLLALAQLQDGPVTLVDAHDGLAGVDRILRRDGGNDDDPVDAAVDAPVPLPRRVELSPELFLVHAGGLGDPAASPAARRSALRRAARGAGGRIIVDAGAAPLTVLHAMRDFGGPLVTVLGTDPVSGPAAYALAKLIWHHHPEADVGALVNRADETEARFAWDAVRLAATRFLDRRVEWLGCLPDVPDLVELPLDAWFHLDEHQPTLSLAAAAAVSRLPSRGHTPDPTLTLLR